MNIFVYAHLNIKIVLFQTIQFRKSTQFSSIWPIDRTLSGATTESRPERDYEGVLRIPEITSIIGTSPSNCLVAKNYLEDAFTYVWIMWHSTNTIGKGMNPIILPPAVGK